jgi:peptidoglycan/xylan/chitin deacetylase (PgdA/CDA1 family)
VWRDFTTATLRNTPPKPLPAPANVGRTDVGDAGQHANQGPDSTAALRPADAGFEPVIRTAGSGRRLALTFDDGPSDYTGAVLDLLAKYHVQATFCVVGEMAQAYPKTVRRIVADGHKLCNHSMHHDDLGKESVTQSRRDIEAADAAIAADAPGATVTYYRAPYGDFGPTAKVAAELGHTPLGWVVDPDDWRLPGVATIVSRIEKGIKPGAVLLVHDGGGNRQQTVDALAVLVPRLLAEGWTFDVPATTVKSHPLGGGDAAAAVSAPPTPVTRPTPSSSPTAPADTSKPDPAPGITVLPSTSPTPTGPN